MLRRSWAWRKMPVEVTRNTSKLPYFDVCVIGGGPAGVAAALRAVDYRKRVCLVEASRVGGVDLWDGTLQSKTLWEMAKYASRLSGPAAQRLFEEDAVAGVKNKISDARVLQALQDVSGIREQQLLDALRTAGVEIVFGKGMFSSPNELDVHSTGSGVYNVVRADYFIIATGGVPRTQFHMEADGRRIVTTETIMRLPIPSSLVIIGAGAIGCEFASIYANLGRTKVSLVDRTPRILQVEDEDISQFVQDQLVRLGVTIHSNCTLFDLESWGDNEEEGGCIYSVRKNDIDVVSPVETYEAERALISVGRVPNVSGLGLENTSCKVTDGRLVVDAFNRCLPHKHIYAIGDVCARRALVNLGEAQGRGAIDHIYSEKPEKSINAEALTNLSTILFLDEELACVGLNEQQCRARSLGYIVARYGYGHLSRALAMGNTTGFCKVIVTSDSEKRLLGVRAFGVHAGSIIEVASLSIRSLESAYELLKLTPSYPSAVQGLVECIRMILGRSALKPNTTPDATLKVWHPPHFRRGREYIDETGYEESVMNSDDVKIART
ncbi:putative dihydrolipoamide dehydrogenase [Trypanosoma cruzi]|uniref:Dihydrolipoamide dehydrogenase, putative n=2 Tax=Trypanosoma cruzi TaxID=5693 RepID=Q4D2Y6_TRYCC|nr:dihydrolipoamide dehydrogenase, putative [Trypanosoma cruzi]EAN86891.1 dihydrolipoamide dehydrogenase, putative [Trypanosoma cruzi]PWV12656.1 putative dihydrolipoamide dehydrogenase [Trypanosoma cruzi]RNC58786.1 putative dihydrolipoamide dehydrogenase [Trypanosoma cruzi]|eukprot:XP_808742.1 dihydrolipoamide dehydrogenase [Trypanosoma cruzi strain CL Brener]